MAALLSFLKFGQKRLNSVRTFAPRSTPIDYSRVSRRVARISAPGRGESIKNQHRAPAFGRSRLLEVGRQRARTRLDLDPIRVEFSRAASRPQGSSEMSACSGLRNSRRLMKRRTRLQSRLAAVIG